MNKGFLQQLHPVLPVHDVKKAIDFYVKKLNFTVAFADRVDHMTYAGITRDGVEIHLQLHNITEWELTVERPMLRFLVNDIEALFEEYKTQNVFHKNTDLRKTPWGTEEFAFYDPFKNGLTFYRDL